MPRLSRKARLYDTSFEKTHNIQDWISYFSICVWDKLQFYYEEESYESKAGEIKFTQDLVSDIAMLIKKDRIPLPIRLFHSPKESFNGSDIEFVVQLRKNKNIIFPCQAKRLYVETDAAKNNNLKARYAKLNYKKGEQKKKLLDYAKRIKGFPLYLLYNYSEHHFKTTRQYPDKELYGCSLISADYLAANPPVSPTVPHLHPPAIPLTSISKVRNINNLKSFWGTVNSHHAKIYTDNDIFDDKIWE